MSRETLAPTEPQRRSAVSLVLPLKRWYRMNGGFPAAHSKRSRVEYAHSKKFAACRTLSGAASVAAEIARRRNPPRCCSGGGRGNARPRKPGRACDPPTAELPSERVSPPPPVACSRRRGICGEFSSFGSVRVLTVPQGEVRNCHPTIHRHPCAGVEPATCSALHAGRRFFGFRRPPAGDADREVGGPWPAAPTQSAARISATARWASRIAASVCGLPAESVPAIAIRPKGCRAETCGRPSPASKDHSGGSKSGL